MSGISWRGILLGAISVIVLFRLIGGLLLYFPILLDSLFDRPEETIVSTPGSALLGVAEILPIVVALFANFAGGLIAGRLSLTRPGLNGIIASLVSASFGFVRLVLLTIYVLSESDWQIRSENGGILIVQIAAALVLLPLAVFCAFIGGRLGGRFARRNAP